MPSSVPDVASAPTFPNTLQMLRNALPYGFERTTQPDSSYRARHGIKQTSLCLDHLDFHVPSSYLHSFTLTLESLTR